MLKLLYNHCFPSKLKENTSQQQFHIIVLSFSLWCLFAHGITLTNKFSFHDDIYLFHSGTAYSSGRWFLGFLSCIRKAFMLGDVSLPLFNGVIGFTYLLCATLLVFSILNLKSNLSCIMLPGVFCTFPVITAILGYNFTFPYYLFALFLSALSVFLLSQNGLAAFISSIILAACSVGIYQAFIPFTVSLLLLQLLVYTINNDELSPRRIMYLTAKRLSFCVCFISLYLVINSIVLHILHLELSDYQNISSIQNDSIITYFLRAKSAYREYIYPLDIRSRSLNSMFFGSMRPIYYVVVILIAISTLIILFEKRRNGILYLLFLSVLFCFLPVAINFIIVMCEDANIHSLMLYSQCLVFAIPLVLYEHTKQLKNKWFSILLSIILFTVNLSYCKYDNACYLKAELTQQRTIEYFSTLVAKIKCTPGYNDDYPVLWINAEAISDKSLVAIQPLSQIRTIPYSDADDLVNTYSWRTFLSYWCAYSPNTIESSPEIETSTQVRSMPHYPDDGSIAVIDDTVVVKF